MPAVKNENIDNTIQNLRVQQLLNRKYTKDTHAILTEFHRNHGNEDAYMDYLKKYNESVKTPYEKPLEMTLVLTNDCNYLCKMCYRNYYKSDVKKYFSDEMLNLIINEAKEINIPSIVLSGGDTTLHPRISDVVRKVGMAGFLNSWLITNGYKLNNETLLETITDMPLTCLSVSLDAANQETYKKIRGGNLNDIEQNIELFLEMRAKKKSKLPLFRVTFIDMPENHDELSQFVEKWEGVADIVDIQTYSNMDPKNKNTGNGKNFICDQPCKRILINQEGEISPCFFAQYQVNTPIYLGRDYNTLMDYWNSDWHLAFCDRHKNNQCDDVCKRCKESFIC